MDWINTNLGISLTSFKQEWENNYLDNVSEGNKCEYHKKRFQEGWIPLGLVPYYPALNRFNGSNKLAKEIVAEITNNGAYDFSKNQHSAKDLKPALEEMDYKPVWMKVIEHNGKIDDRIIAEIRRSGLVISDFTGNRGGVYYEAGFAQGLGIPVIWMCKNDPEELKNLHFDTRQYNHILWENAGDLKEKLINRIGAKFPGRAQRTTGKKPD